MLSTQPISSSATFRAERRTQQGLSMTQNGTHALTDALDEGGRADAAQAGLDASVVVLLHLLDGLHEDLVADEGRVLAHAHAAAGHAGVEGAAQHLRVQLLDQRRAQEVLQILAGPKLRQLRVELLREKAGRKGDMMRERKFVPSYMSWSSLVLRFLPFPSP